MSCQKMFPRLAAICVTLAMAGCQSSNEDPHATSASSSSSSTPKVRTVAVATTQPAVTKRTDTRSDDAQLASYQQGDSWNKGRMAFPTGDEATSALLLEKSVPVEVISGRPYQYDIKVTNLTRAPLDAVEVNETIPGTVKLSEMTGMALKDGSAHYSFGSLAPGESKTARVTATATGTDAISSCASASYSSALCLSTNVVAPAIKLTLTAPEEVMVCDVVPIKLVVTNSGSGTARNVHIESALPPGMTTADGKTTFGYDLPSIAGGEAKEITFNAKVSKIGKYEQKASARADDGLVTQPVLASTLVKQPILEITKTGAEKVYIGRPVTYEITVKNKGDAIARETIVTDTIPADAKFDSASDNGRASGGKVQWALGDLAPGASKKITVAFNGTGAGTLTSQATAQSRCADAVTAVAKTEYIGIPAILLECVDLTDPIPVGENETYVITATNQGSAVATNVKIVCKLEDTMGFVSASGASKAAADGKTLTFEPVATIAPKAKAEWRVVIKAVGAGDTRFKIEMTSDQLTRPVEETESSNFYK